MANLLDLLFYMRQLSFRFSFLSLVCWSCHCCYIVQIMAIIYNSPSHIAWEDSSVKPEKHIKPRNVSGISPALCYCSVYSCVLLCFGFGFSALSVPGLAVCLLSPFLIQHPIDWVVIYVGKNTQHNERSLNPSIWDLSCISGKVQTVAFPNE